MRILQISDLHLPADSNNSTEGIGAFDRCRRLAEHLKNEPADLLVVTGDIAAEREGIPCYRFVKETLNTLPCPWVVLPGNHDRGDLFREVFGPRAKTGFEIYPDQGDSQIAFFDSSGEEPALLDLLEDYLKNAVGPVCLFTHYPPIPVGHPSYDGKHALPWRDQFHSVLQKATRPLYVFFGHIHFEFHQESGPIHFYSVPSATVPLIPGIGRDDPDLRGLAYRQITTGPRSLQTSVHFVPLE